MAAHRIPIPEREAKLALALRDNLRRRKAQAREKTIRPEPLSHAPEPITDA